MIGLFSLIPVEKLEKSLSALAACLELPVQLLDAEGTLLRQFGQACNYCRILKKRVFAPEECAHVHLRAGESAYALGESYIFSCHADLNHIAFSLVSHKSLLGTVIVGPFLMDKPDSTLLSTFAEKYSLSPALCLDLYDELQALPVVPPEKVNAVGQLLDSLLGPLLSGERLLMQEKQEKLYQQSRIHETIQAYKGTQNPSPSAFIYEKENELLSKVRQCDMKSAKGLLNELLGFVLLTEGQNLALIRTRAFELTILLSRVAIEGGAPAERILAMNPKFLDQLQQAQTYEDLCFSLQEIVENFVDATSIPGPAHGNGVMRKAVAYMNKNFDQALTVKTLCDELQISPSYFSALFAKHMGMGFHEYLTRIRMEEARRLLTATDYPISQIAVTVGYADQSSFTKAFKRVTGITPYQMR